MIVSLPTRECGLKPLADISGTKKGTSLPTRECGLKRRLSNPYPEPIRVTPHAGVWIETSDWWANNHQDTVTPHAGVWIETLLVAGE